MNDPITPSNLDMMPGFGPGPAQKDLRNFRVRYLKVDFDEASDLLELESLETRGIRGEDVVILNKDKFTFMQKYFLIVAYLEKIND